MALDIAGDVASSTNLSLDAAYWRHRRVGAFQHGDDAVADRAFKKTEHTIVDSSATMSHVDG